GGGRGGGGGGGGGEGGRLVAGGPRLLQEARVRGPAAGGDAVERGEDGHVNSVLHPPEMLQVLVGPERSFGIRRVARRLGERLGVAFGVEESGHLLARDRLFVERRQDERGGARVL